MAQLTIANSNTQHYVKMLCTTTTNWPPSTSKFYVDFQRSKKWNTPFYLQMFCALSGRSLSWNTPVFSRFTSREHANFIGCHFFLHSYASSSFKGAAPKVLWEKVISRRVPWFGRHVENLGDVIIYPVLVVARTVVASHAGVFRGARISSLPTVRT